MNVESVKSKGLNLQTIKDNFAIWAATFIFGFGNYQLMEISKSVQELSKSLAVRATISDNQDSKIKEHSKKINTVEEKVSNHNVEIAELRLIASKPSKKWYQ